MDHRYLPKPFFPWDAVCSLHGWEGLAAARAVMGVDRWPLKPDQVALLLEGTSYDELPSKRGSNLHPLV